MHVATRALLRFDWYLLIFATSLATIGLLTIYGIDVARGGGELFQFKKQLLAVIIGLGVTAGLATIDYRQIRSYALPIYLFGLALLGLALPFGTTNVNGGKWFIIGSLSFQPVELAKVILVVFLAAYLSKFSRKRMTWLAFIGSGLVTFAYVALVMVQPDFGSAMVLVASWFGVVLFCGLPKRAWWILGVSGLLISTLAWSFALKPYQKDRITSFINPTDTYGSAYNVIQANIAIGSGGWLGKGVGEGTQARLRFLPEASNDFLFAVIGEELGFLGVGVVLTLFGLLFHRLLLIASRSDDAFAGIMLVGIASIIAFHLCVNAGMNLGVMPVTGIPLPFLSAAASSVVALFICIGLAESVAAHGGGGFE